MSLTKKPLELGAIEYATQTQYRRIAVGAVLAYIDVGVASTVNPEDDVAWSQYERNWLIETVHQGAYIRHYHDWEKDCKQYLVPKGMNSKRTSDIGFTQHVKDFLSSLSVSVPDSIIRALDTMRNKVNDMKHETGIQNKDFVTADEYNTGAIAIQDFWDFLVGEEVDQR
jgi:hypothetical protein